MAIQRADASKPIIKVNRSRKPRATLNGRQNEFIEEYMANGQNASAAYRKAYRCKTSSMRCSTLAHILMDNPVVALAIKRRVKMLELARENRFEALQITEERIIEVLSTLALYDPRSVIQWDSKGVTVTRSADLPIEAVFAIREIQVTADGGLRFKFADRRAALMDLARIRGMVTDKSASFHFHEDLAKMSPDEQKKRVAELLEFAANLRVPADADVIDVTPEEENEGGGG